MIRVKNLSLSIAGKAILKNISFNVEKGKTLAIIGESGGGKSTLARILLGLVNGRPLEHTAHVNHRALNFQWSGEAWIDHTDILKANGSDLTRIRGIRTGLIVQALSDALNPHLTVLQHVREKLLIHHMSNTDAAEICLKYNIPDHLLHRYPKGLSGGETQRVITALSLLNQPDYLILDEPTAALDPKNREVAISAFMKESEMRSQILITHDLALARELADSIGVMYQGEIIELQETKKIFDAPQKDYTLQLFASEMCLWPKSFDFDKAVKPISLTGAKKLSDRSHQKGTDGLYIHNLSHHIKDRTILNQISIFVPEASCMAILGPSGCGKSTFARLLTGYEKHQIGEIYWYSETTGKKPLHKGRASLISQHPHGAMARHFSVENCLKEALILAEKADKEGRKKSYTTRIKTLLSHVGLPQNDVFLKRKTARLSGGEAQRLVIARALTANPYVLVADEPTSALDMCARQQIISLLQQLKTEQGLTLVLFTHDYDTAKALADQIIEF